MTLLINDEFNINNEKFRQVPTCKLSRNLIKIWKPL